LNSEQDMPYRHSRRSLNLLIKNGICQRFFAIFFCFSVYISIC
jgi:hypothetical protein